MATPTIPDWPSYTDDDLVSDNGTDIDVAFLDAIGNAIQDSITGADNPSIYASAIIDEVIAARGGYADLDERLDQPVVGTINTSVNASDIVDEVVAARDNNPDLDDRLNNFVDDEIPNASGATRGLVSAAAQSWDGVKTLTSMPLIRPGGASSGAEPAALVLIADGAEYPNVDATELDTTSYTLLANTLNTNGQSIRIRAWGRTGSGASNRVVRIYWNGSAILTTPVWTTADGSWSVEAIITRNAAGAQSAYAVFHRSTALNTATPTAETTLHTAWDSLAADETGAIIVKLSIDVDAATAAAIVQLGCIIELLTA